MPFACPDLVEVARISALAEPVTRNLQITQAYHELSQRLAERTGLQANWCTFAAWASRQAGQTIRQEDLQRSLVAALGSQAAAHQAVQDVQSAAAHLGAALDRDKIIAWLLRAYNVPAAFERSSAAVARGNLKVFAEIAHEFARFYETLVDDAVYDENRLAAFTAALHPGPPPDGQDNLRRAFEHYYRALFTSEAKARVELLLLANLEIGFHEQTRLQPDIQEALNAPVVPLPTLAANLLKELKGGWLASLGWLALRLLGRLKELDVAVQALTGLLQSQAQVIITETMMTIDLPGYPRLRLGEDVPGPFPPMLALLMNPELRALLVQVDASPDTPAGSEAQDWGRLTDRLHFIADLFRRFALDPALFEPPFTPAQTQAIQQGQVPAGEL